MQNWNFLVVFLVHIKIVLGVCPGSNPIAETHICGPVTAPEQASFLMDFSSFENTSESSCQCSFTAPQVGNFTMKPTFFPESNDCGTRISISVNGNVTQGRSIECRQFEFPTTNVQRGDKVEMKIISTLSSTRSAEYCYVATFTSTVNLTCTAGSNEITTTTAKTTPFPSTTVASSTTMTDSKTTTSGSPKTQPRNEQDNVQRGTLTTIGIPAAVGSVIVILIVVIVAVVCYRRMKKAKKCAGSGHSNQNFNMENEENYGLKDNIIYKAADNGGLKDNIIYRSADNGGYSDISDGHYSSDREQSTEMVDSPKHVDQSSSWKNDIQIENNATGDVYAVVDKTKSKIKKQGLPLSKKPSNNGQVHVNEDAGIPVYAVSDKSRTRNTKSNDYDYPPNNRPILPTKPVRTYNQDGLLYSEVDDLGPIPDLPNTKSHNNERKGVTYSDIRAVT